MCRGAFTEDTTTSFFSPSSSHPSPFLPRFLVPSASLSIVVFFPSSAIMIPTRSRLVIILMASCTRGLSGARQKEHQGASYAEKLVIRSGRGVLRRILCAYRGFARVNLHELASHSFVRPVLLFLIKLM